MRIVPYTQLVLAFILLSTITGVVLWPQPSSPGTLNDDVNTTTSTDSVSDFTETNNSAGDEYSIEREGVADVSGSEGLQGQLISYPLTTLVIYLIAYLGLVGVIGWGFRTYINLPSVQMLVNNSLQLAGFRSRVGSGGRQWTIDNQFILELSSSSPHFTLYLPENEKDPRLYGFKPTHNISVSCTSSQFQLTLQSVRAYLD